MIIKSIQKGLNPIYYYNKGIDIWIEHNPNDHNIAGSYNNLGLVYQNKGDYKNAIWYLEKAKDFLIKVIPNHPMVVKTYNTLELVKACQEIETKIMSAFSSLKKIKYESSDVLINISTQGIKKEDIKNYCTYKFGSNFSEWEFDNNECSIILDKSCREILKNTLALQEQLNTTNHTLKGSDLTVDLNITWINSFFSKYTQEGIKDILDLRIKDLKIAGVQVLSATFINETNNNIREILSKIENITDTIILVPLNLSNKHAVGLILRTEDSFFQIKYIDPMNNPIPSELLKIIQNILPNSQYKQIAVEKQRYANCGPEVIEDFVLYLTGERVSQEKAIELHSKLVENSLLDLTIPDTCLLFEQSNYDKFQPDICLSGNHNEEIC